MRTRTRTTLTVFGAIGAVIVAAAVPTLLAPSSPSPAPTPTEMPPQLVGVQWDECMIGNPVPDGVLGFNVDRAGGTIDVEVQDPEGRTLSDDEIVANPRIRSFVVNLQACLSRYPLGPDSGPAQLDLAERAIYYDNLVGTLVPCLDRHGVATSVPIRSSVRYLDLTSWYLQAIDLADVGLDNALEIWDECPLLPSYLEGS